MRNLYPKRKKNKFSEFIKGRAFYLVLTFCLVAVGTVGYISIKNIISSTDMSDWEKAAQNALDSEANQNNNSAEPAIKPAEGIKESSSKSSSSKASSQPVSSSSQAKQAVKYQMPATGNIITAFSIDNPVYNKTMNDWRAHTGIDIAGNDGDLVKAAGDGTIEDIFTDELKGVTVTIKHSDGVNSIYCGLQKNPSCTKGKAVKAGDVIGRMGNTAAFEANDGVHLHFEMIKNGIYLNPQAMMKD